VADKQHDPPVRHLDRRVVERYVKKGLLDEKATKIETEFQTEGEIGPAR